MMEIKKLRNVYYERFSCTEHRLLELSIYTKKMPLNAPKYGTLIHFMLCFILLFSLFKSCVFFFISSKYLWIVCKWLYACAFGWLSQNRTWWEYWHSFPTLFNFVFHLSNFKVGFVFVCLDRQNTHTNQFWMWIENDVQLTLQDFHGIISKDNQLASDEFLFVNLISSCRKYKRWKSEWGVTAK